MTGKIVIVSEAGWQGARELSIEISERSVEVINLIKGRPDKDVINMITKRRKVKNIFIPQSLFPVILFQYILRYSFFSKTLFAFLTKEKTEKMLSKLKGISKNIRLARLREEKGHFAVFDLNMNKLDYKKFLGTV